MTVEELNVIVSANTADFKKQFSEINTQLSGLDAKASSAASGIKNAFNAVVASGAVMAIADLGKTAITAAGELEQNLGGSEAVFADFAASVQKSAEGAYSALGLSESAYLATVNKMGALFQGSGFTIEQSADMSTQAMQRAADVASIMGISVEDAMNAVAGAAKGNFTMMDNLGVAINDTTLQIYAQENGLGKLETTQQKVNAAMQMFMEKTEYAAGTYEKENATYAGALTTLKAQLQNFAADAGSALLPLATEIMPVLTEALTSVEPIIMELTGGIGGLGAPLADIIDKLVPPITHLLSKLLPSVVTILEDAVVPVLDGVVIPLLDLVMVVLDPILDLVVELIGPISSLVGAVSKVAEAGISVVKEVLEPMMGDTDEILDLIGTLVGEYLLVLVDLLNNSIVPLLNGLADLLSGDLMGALQGFSEGFIGYFQTAFETVDKLFGTNLSQWYSDLTSFWRDAGSKLYELTHAEEIDKLELDSKYGNLDNQIVLKSNEYMRSGMSAGEAQEKALNEVLDTQEKSYYFNTYLAPTMDATYGSAEERYEQVRNQTPTYDATAYTSAFNPSDYYSTVNQRKIRAYASGGFPDYGDIFIANEAGPELVGTIGGRSAVANSGQIEAAIYNAVRSAIMDCESGEQQPIEVHTTVEIDGDKIGESINSYNASKKRIFNGW